MKKSVAEVKAALARDGHKPRFQGSLNSLTPKQTDRLHQLFRENVSYKEIVVRMRTEFGFRTSSSSLSTYYSKRAREVFELDAADQPQRGETREIRLIIHLEIHPVVSSVHVI